MDDEYEIKEGCEDSKDDMTLPKGKTCNDCVHVHICTLLFGAKPENKECDFYPIRFQGREGEGND